MESSNVTGGCEKCHVKVGEYSVMVILSVEGIWKRDLYERQPDADRPIGIIRWRILESLCIVGSFRGGGMINRCHVIRVYP